MGLMGVKLQVCCPTCGRVDLRASEVTVRMCLDTSEANYRFRCPVCAMCVVHRAAAVLVPVLSRAGARLESWHTPDELAERPDSSARPITHDDLMEFRQQLDGLP